MKKTFDTTSIMNELRGQSAFFPTYHRDNQSEADQKEKDKNESNLASSHASTLASEEFIEVTRKILKLLGKEVIYVRSTQEEKEQIGDIVYTLKRQGMKTSDNEICRIAINFILAEYKTNGEQSVLAKVLKALHT